MAIPVLFDERARYSSDKLLEFSRRLERLEELRRFSDLTMFAAGSFGRLEASQYSDLDVFFLTKGDGQDIKEPKTKQLRMFAKIIETADLMAFPQFSNDCEYLVVLHTEQILSNLGGRVDDHANYFTARMLLLLESRCVYGTDVFNEIVKSIVGSYFTDFPDHQQTFQPIFLLNDICRFWKTLLLNYENKRRFQAADADELKKTKQKVKNFKLKFSRMTTCFASIAALGSFTAPVTVEQVVEITQLTPCGRLQHLATRLPGLVTVIDHVLTEYAWFLEMTALPTSELELHFSDKAKRTEMFRRANAYGDLMFTLLQEVDSTDSRLRLLRNLVI